MSVKTKRIAPKITPRRRTPSISKNKSIYKKDFYEWTKEQATHLKEKDFSHLDIDHLVEEIEALGISDLRALKSHLINLLVHLLKCKYQPVKRTRSWENSITNAIMKIDLILDDSPSLRSEILSITDYVYKKAREKASRETRLNIKNFPEKCEWNLQKAFSGKIDVDSALEWRKK